MEQCHSTILPKCPSAASTVPCASGARLVGRTRLLGSRGAQVHLRGAECQKVPLPSAVRSRQPGQSPRPAQCRALGVRLRLRRRRGRAAADRAGTNRESPAQVAWLARTEDEDREAAPARGFPAVLTSSARGLWLTLRAQVVVVTHGFGDVNRYGIRGAFIVQLWHGIPLKLIHLDSPATLRSSILPRSKAMRWLLERMYRQGGLRNPADARRVGAGGARGCAPRSACRLTGWWSPAIRATTCCCAARRPAHRRGGQATLGELLPAAPLKGARVLLYAPTWREGDPDPAVPTAAQWTLIGDYLAATNSVLLIRSHPLGIGEYAAGPASSDRIWMFGKQLRSDVTELLAGRGRAHHRLLLHRVRLRPDRRLPVLPRPGSGILFPQPRPLRAVPDLQRRARGDHLGGPDRADAAVRRGCRTARPRCVTTPPGWPTDTTRSATAGILRECTSTSSNG